MRKRRASSESGVILIAVLGGILLLTMTAFALSSAVRIGTEGLKDRKEHLQAYYLARGAVFKSAWLLSQSSDSNNAVIHPGQRSIAWNLSNGRVQVDFSDEAGKLDLNQVKEPLLEKLLIALGYEFKDARGLATSIVDWRDPSSLARWEHARASGNLLEYAPTAAQTRYQSVEEILNVPGMTLETFYGHYVRGKDGRISRIPGLIDCLTVDSGSSRVNINYSAYPLLLALTDMDSRTADFIASRRAEKPFVSLSDITREFPASLTSESLSLMTTQETGIFVILATGQSNSGITARIRAVVKVRGQQNRPFQIMRWKDSHVQ